MHATDDFFAAKENMIKHAAPIRNNEFTENGKWMDGKILIVCRLKLTMKAGKVAERELEDMILPPFAWVCPARSLEWILTPLSSVETNRKRSSWKEFTTPSPANPMVRWMRTLNWPMSPILIWNGK